MTEPGLNELNAVLARVPSVERVLSSAPLQPLLADYGRTRVLNAVRAELERQIPQVVLGSLVLGERIDTDFRGGWKGRIGIQQLEAQTVGHSVDGDL